MLVVAALLSVPVSVSIALSQEQHYLQVKPESRVETLPGELIVSALQISNPDNQNLTFDLAIECPAGWQVVSGDGQIEIDPGKGIQRLASFLSPDRERAGEYPVSFILRSSDGEVLESLMISVTILPSPEIQLTDLVNLKRNAIAGDTVKFDFQLSNTGNVPVVVILDAHMSMGVVNPDSTEDKISLDAGESRMIIIETVLDNDFDILTGVPLILTARVLLDGKVIETASKEATSKLDVYPGGSTGSDEFNYLPGKIKLKGIIEDSEKTRSDWQTEVSMDGSLKDDDSDNFSLMYRGPAPNQPDLIFSKDEEFHLSYDREDFGIYLGDGNYFLSPLIDNSGRGRGFEMNNRFDDFDLKIYFSHSSRNPSDENIIGVDMGFPIDENNEISLLYFNADVHKPFSSNIDDRSIWGFRGELGNTENLDVDFEFAQGGEENLSGRDFAYRFEGTYRDNGLELSANRIFAGPGFGGYYRDMNFSELSASVPLGDGFKVRGNFRDQQRNYNRDSDGFSSFRDKDIMAGIGYSGKHGVSLTADYIDKYRVDLDEDPLFSSEQRFWRLGASRQFGDLFLSTRIEFGENEDRVLDETVNHMSQYGSFSWKVDKNLTIFGYANWSKGDSLDIHEGKTTRSGFHFSYSPQNSLTLTTGMNFELVSDSFRRFYIPFSFRYQFKNGDQIEVRARYTTTERSNLEWDDTAVMIEYIVPLSIKIDRKSGYCILTGFVKDITTGEPLKGVLVHTENRADLTDETGRYEIKDLIPGTNIVSVNLSNLSYKYITVPESPAIIELAEGISQMDFLVVTAGSISGRVRMASGLSGSDGLEGVMVELISAEGSVLRLTDESGRFRFELLPPGHYKISIDPKNLPVYTHLEMDKYDFDLTAGMEIDLDAKVVEDTVKVKIIKEDEITLTK
jgi:hypothetical protein